MAACSARTTLRPGPGPEVYINPRHPPWFLGAKNIRAKGYDMIIVIIYDIYMILSTIKFKMNPSYNYVQLLIMYNTCLCHSVCVQYIADMIKALSL